MVKRIRSMQKTAVDSRVKKIKSKSAYTHDYADFKLIILPLSLHVQKVSYPGWRYTQ